MTIPPTDRLPFVLPEFTRVIWVSDAARETWGPRITAVTRAWFDIEWQTVRHGIREIGVTIVPVEGLAAGTERWATHGLAALPLGEEPGGACRVAVGRQARLDAFAGAIAGGDDAAVAALLGHPPCCTASSKRVWVQDGLSDTTWPMAIATGGAQTNGRETTVQGAPEANMLWRWVGLRAVPHLPCAFDCPLSVALGRASIDVGRRAGHGQEMAWLEEILDWPAEWSALHGIAEVRTPVLKVSTRTDATTVRYVVRRLSSRYPSEGAAGLRFPYRASMVLAKSR